LPVVMSVTSERAKTIQHLPLGGVHVSARLGRFSASALQTAFARCRFRNSRQGHPWEETCRPVGPTYGEPANYRRLCGLLRGAGSQDCLRKWPGRQDFGGTLGGSRRRTRRRRLGVQISLQFRLSTEDSAAAETSSVEGRIRRDIHIRSTGLAEKELPSSSRTSEKMCVTQKQRRSTALRVSHSQP
jgi:hypothetical protein